MRVRITRSSFFGKHADDSIDGLGSVDRVQRRQHQVARFGSLERHLDRFLVAHFAHQNHFRRLPQSGAQGNRKTWRIGVEFALVNRRILVCVQKLDRIFDGDDVVGLRLINQIDNRRQR